MIELQMVQTSKKDLDGLKEKAQSFFNDKQYEDSIKCYSELLKLSDSPAVCYTNRALCHLKLGTWSGVKDDAIKALDVNPNYVKAIYYLGIAYYELGQFNDAIKCFENVRDLAHEQRLNFGSMIADQLRKAYNKIWELKNNEHDQQFMRLSSFVEELVDPLLEHRPERCQLKQELQDYIKAYNQEKKSAKNLPDYLTCQLCYDLFVDPVITPSGITYCRKCIEANIHKVNHVDPITNDKLEASYLITNRCVREAAISFADDTDWFARSDS